MAQNSRKIGTRALVGRLGMQQANGLHWSTLMYAKKIAWDVTRAQLIARVAAGGAPYSGLHGALG